MHFLEDDISLERQELNNASKIIERTNATIFLGIL